MEKSDLAGGLVMTLVSLASVFYSLSLPQGLTEMGVLKAGVFPLIISSALLLFSLSLVIQSVLAQKKHKKANKLEPALLLKKLYGKSALWIYSVFVYFFLTDILGYAIATFIYIFLTLRFWFKYKPIFSILTGIAVTLGTYLVFNTFLKITLPPGLFIGG